MQKKINGFTLIEVLVALFIFAIVGVMAASSLQTLLRNHRVMQRKNTELLQLNLAMALLRRDISQAIDRPIMGENGNQVAFSGAQDSMMFTRAGLINPLNISERSNMQRIGYAFQGGVLTRLTWSVLDQPPDAKAESQPLLTGIRSIEWQYIGDGGQKSFTWPMTNQRKQTDAAPRSALPSTVLMVLHFQDGGVISSAFSIPARGAHAAQAV